MQTIFLQSVLRSLPKMQLSVKSLFFNKQFFFVLPIKNVYFFSKFLRDFTHAQFKLLIDVTVVDYPGRINNRFELVYSYLSITYNCRVIVKTFANEFSVVPSLTPLFSSANWYEREVWDLFGIFFSNHLDLRRLVSDYGFEGHALRKDFPLTGFFEVRYDENEKRVVLETVELAQEFKVFNFSNPWPVLGVVTL
jgi:NADH dehydrogenase (ubiquinone) Fe-S protein 3